MVKEYFLGIDIGTHNSKGVLVSAKADYGSSYLLQSILAVILGGASISGGFGKLRDLVISILILQMISSGLNIFGLGINMMIVDIIWGLFNNSNDARKFCIR